MPNPTATPPQDFRRHLETLRELRGKDARGTAPPRLAELKRWQQRRLARTHADLAERPRYAKATAFFLEDLYGEKDFSGRDAAMVRIYPFMARTMPAAAVLTAAQAIEVDALSETLDQSVAAALPEGPITDASYGAAYRAGSTTEQRERQIALIDAVGKGLDRMVARPMVLRTLKLMRAPARLAGLEDLQSFLERGFDAFQAMGGAAEFLETIAERERAIASRLFSSSPAPFSP